MSASLWVKTLLGVVSCVFVYFFVIAAFGDNPQEASETTKGLLAVAAAGFGLTAIIYP